MTECERILERLAERLDGPLEEVDRHLAVCPACRAEWQALSQDFVDLRGLKAPPMPPPDCFWLRYELAAERPRPDLAWERRSRTLQRGLAAAAVALMLTAGTLLGWCALSAATRPLQELTPGHGAVVTEVKPR
ncbi:MAG: hypothetical protein AB1758_27205 [Candidatus Eremiobacterota bacterium]